MAEEAGVNVRNILAAVAYLLLSGACDAQVCQLKSADGGRGSAVCVGTFDHDGSSVFLTAGHCIDKSGVWLAPEGRWLQAEPMAWWAAGPGKDLAIVRCGAYKPSRTYEIGTASPAVGSEVVVAGFANAGELTVTQTRVMGYGRGEMRLACRGVSGVSGGPILVGRKVVGILTHDDTTNRCGVATNAETILATLRSWRAEPGAKQAAWIGIGMGGGYCGPYGCYPRPVVPVYPAMPVQPYYAAPVVPVQPQPQQPYNDAPQSPGYPGWATRPEEKPTTPPVQPLPVTPQNPSADLSSINASIERLELAITAMRAKQGDTAGLADRVSRLEQAEIPVRIVDQDGKTVDERRYKLGETLEFKLVPRTAK